MGNTQLAIQHPHTFPTTTYHSHVSRRAPNKHDNNRKHNGKQQPKLQQQGRKQPKTGNTKQSRLLQPPRSPGIPWIKTSTTTYNAEKPTRQTDKIPSISRPEADAPSTSNIANTSP